jgi:AcrR family transcriptional regulator
MANASDAESERRAKRSDAQRNRQSILKAAFEVFSELGVDAQMVDVANAAGLGVGTVYRNFESKEVLVNALLLDRLTGAAHVAGKAAEEPDAWNALRELMNGITVRQLENRVLSQFLGGRIAGSPELQKQRDHVYGIIDGIVLRAKDAGQLREDVNISDIRMIMTSIANLSASDSPVAQHLVRRHIGILLDGLRPVQPSALPSPPVGLEQSEEVFNYSSAPLNRNLRRGRRTWPVK